MANKKVKRDGMTEMIFIRVSKTDKEAIEESARLQGFDYVSDYIRTLLRANLKMK